MPRNLTTASTVNDLLDDQAKFKPDALRAIRAFARAKPWQGTHAERLVKFQTCADGLASAYGIGPVTVVTDARRERETIDPESRTIHLSLRMSVVTFLHLFDRLRGHGSLNAFHWSVNLFRRKFPLSYSRCRHDGLLLRRDD